MSPSMGFLRLSFFALAAAAFAVAVGACSVTSVEAARDVDASPGVTPPGADPADASVGERGDGSGPSAWEQMPTTLGTAQAVGAYQENVWAVFGTGSENDGTYRGAVARFDGAKGWSVVVPEAAGPLLKPSASATLQGVGPRAAVYKNDYHVTLLVEGQSPKRLGEDAVSLGRLHRLDARAADDVWVSQQGAGAYHLRGSEVDALCIESDIPKKCGGGFTPGIFYDGKKLWLAASADASGQSPGLYAIDPSTPGFLKGTLALSEKFDIIARGPGDTAWAIGVAGIAAHFDGTSWTPSSTGIVLDQISGAVVQDDGQVWVLGHRALVHFDGKSWQTVKEAGAPEGGVSIAVAGRGTVFVVNGGRIYRRSPH